MLNICHAEKVLHQLLHPPTVAQDTIPPTVLQIDPADDSSGISPTTIVKIVFSEPMLNTSVKDGISLLTDGEVIQAEVTYDDITNSVG